MDDTLLNKKYKLDERVSALNEEATSLDARVTALEEGGSGLPDYSTTEQLTGQKWIDGKDIYFKVINTAIAMKVYLSVKRKVYLLFVR